MASSKKRLGRGLGSLIAGGIAPGKDSSGESPLKPAPKKKAAKKVITKSRAPAPKTKASRPVREEPRGTPGYKEIPVSQVEPNPFQPRSDFNLTYIEELAASIRAEGLLQPIVVRQRDGIFQLIAGERRWRAFQHLKLKTIPARIVEASDSSSASLALIENLQREGLNPIEEAHGYASLIRDFDLTQEAAAERVGKGRATVANSLRLLNLDPEVQGYLSKGLISTGHAKVLLSLPEVGHQKLLAKVILEKGLSVRATEMELKRLTDNVKRSSGTMTSAPAMAAEHTAILALEKRMMDELNTRVSLKHHPKKGRIVIEYQGNDDLQRILEKLGLG